MEQFDVMSVVWVILGMYALGIKLSDVAKEFKSARDILAGNEVSTTNKQSYSSYDWSVVNAKKAEYYKMKKKDRAKLTGLSKDEQKALDLVNAGWKPNGKMQRRED